MPKFFCLSIYHKFKFLESENAGKADKSCNFGGVNKNQRNNIQVSRQFLGKECNFIQGELHINERQSLNDALIAIWDGLRYAVREVREMESTEMGKLLYQLRREKQMTQRQVAEILHISPQAVSRWERGIGYPDVSLLPELSRLYGVATERLLCGSLEPARKDGGNMKRIKFYVCPDCGNILTATGGGELHCCGRRLEALKPQKADAEHAVCVQEIEEDWYVTFPHPMEKGHFFRFAAYVTVDRVLLVRLYPEQGGAFRIPQIRGGGKLYLCCSRHGLFQI